MKRSGYRVCVVTDRVGFGCHKKVSKGRPFDHDGYWVNEYDL